MTFQQKQQLEPKAPLTEKEINEKMREVINRLTSYTGWYCINQESGLGVELLVKELYIQSAITQAHIQVISSMLPAFLRIDELKIMENVTALLEARLMALENQFSISITEKECGRSVKQ